jgi:hypothetical protein
MCLEVCFAVMMKLAAVGARPARHRLRSVHGCVPTVPFVIAIPFFYHTARSVHQPGQARSVGAGSNADVVRV